MDSKGFRVPGTPDLVQQPTVWRVKEIVGKVPGQPTSIPTQDVRYSAFAAPMSDGRLVTDYRQSCVSRAPYGSQNAVKQWMVHNADDIIKTSIKRQAETTTGLHFLSDTPLPPPAAIQKSTTRYSEIVQTGEPFGLGLERAGTEAPTLPGTFWFVPTTPHPNLKQIALTRRFEGGRNTANRWTYSTPTCPS